MPIHRLVLKTLLLGHCLQETWAIEQAVLEACSDDRHGNLLLQTAALPAGKKPWDRRNYLVATSHKAGSHLLRNVMHRTFDILGANFSCHYILKESAAVITENGNHFCLEEKAPLRFQNANNAFTILEMRQEGPMKGVMIIRDPFDMVASAYVYHHRGAEPGNPLAPAHIQQMGPFLGVPMMAQTMWPVVQSMSQAYEVAGDDVLSVRYEDFIRSSADFDATMEKILNFLFDHEITEAARQRILQSAKNEDINGPYGLNHSLDALALGEAFPVNHTNDADDLKSAKLAVSLIPADLHKKYSEVRQMMGYK